jgi:hypothetical protein
MTLDLEDHGPHRFGMDRFGYGLNWSKIAPHWGLLVAL